MSEPGGVSVVVLAKESSQAKTRLGLSPELARQTALGLAARTLQAAREARGVGAVLVVTSDALIAQYARDSGALVVHEGISPLGMNPAADLGRRRALSIRPRTAVAVAVADLPYLEPDDIGCVVAEHHEMGRPLFVPDSRGDGTTFLIHGAADQPRIAFGPRSAEAHRRLGFSPSRLATMGMRTDLDTADDLAAVRLHPPPVAKQPSGTTALMTMQTRSW